ncbi:antitoxin [Branchiibius sp. NY16-3462-2]|uniref:FitA-like ribbon-helix-helix domain-containing protein n=1 Tax=Branchiibius sp. NY16-3462-2 TaxID=1807500 RepID=UPI000792402C|nr:antitoxin [Branchiibius sp. NY16-3462-2]KYH45213.1 plasmid stability protein [Branchiibius sp. NY16-3462-2]
MAAITIRNLSDETHRALKARAAANHRSTEAEVRAILEQAAHGEADVGLGTRLHGIAAAVGGFDLDIERSTVASEPIDFS